MKKLTYRIEGMVPILFHNVESMLLKKPSGVKNEEWEKDEKCYKAKLYWENDKIVIPPKVWLGHLKKAAKVAYQMGIKNGRSSYTEWIKALIFVEEPMILEQQYDKVEPKKDIVPIQKDKVLRIWPSLKEWSGKVTITVADEKIIPIDLIDKLFEIGGMYIGLCDYRPQFGRYIAKRIK